MKTVLKNGNVFYQNKIQKLDVEIDGETISQIGHDLDGENIIDCTDLLVTPGFVDLHVHLREPGFEHKGTIKTETLSAKYGGYTHIVAMANTNPCMDDKETIEDFIQRVQKDSSIHTYTYSAITKDLKGQELVDFKENNAFDIVQGFSDDGKGVQSKEMMAKAMKEAKAINSIIVAHCEDEGELEKGACINLGRVSKENGLVGINNASEYNHALRDLQLSKEIGNRYHICHISTKETVAGLREYRKQGLPVSGEACPHHLILTDENIKNLNPNYKMNPPLRSKEDLDALIEGLKDGTVTCISTDHAPHSDEEKLKPITDGCVAVSYSSNRYMEFNALGVDKGQGLIDLANKLGIDIKDTIAVGDNYNDISMLKVAGLAVAANNAVDDVKAICDYVTEANNNEGVVAEVIERFIDNEI